MMDETRTTPDSELTRPIPTYAPEPQPSRVPSVGTILVGGLLVLFGLLWLLESAGAIDSPWQAVLPGSLIVIGVALLIESRTGAHAGLIVVGSLLTLALTAAALVDIPLSGGVGENVVRPASVAALDEQYHWAIGQQTIDLRDIAASDLPAGETRVEARVGIGELVIRPPADVAIEIEWRAGIGEARVLGTQRGGLGVRGEWSSADFDNAERRLVIVASVGIGSIEVRNAR
jgi:hypothetical protein